ncbi:MAG TPA: hypothetical protein VEW04_09210 [Allosphingosinicella sp.]|nr:hypothetical protein [Allosphingosinicella sp.]
MRIALLALLLASCGSPPAGDTANRTAAAPSAPDDRVDCQIEGAEAFEHNCIVEIADAADGRLLTIRKPDGGFRRLQLTNDGHGVVAADGAEMAVVTLLPDERIEVAIGADRFRLPARIRGR